MAKVPNVKAKSDPNEQKRMENFLNDMQNKTISYINMSDKKEDIIVDEPDEKIKLKDVPTLIIKNCQNMTFIFHCKLTKIFIESCKNINITINNKVLTRTAEIWNGNDINFIINTDMKTIQLDMLNGINLVYAKQSYYKAIVYNQVENFND